MEGAEEEQEEQEEVEGLHHHLCWVQKGQEEVRDPRSAVG